MLLPLFHAVDPKVEPLKLVGTLILPLHHLHRTRAMFELNSIDCPRSG